MHSRIQQARTRAECALSVLVVVQSSRYGELSLSWSKWERLRLAFVNAHGRGMQIISRRYSI